MTFESKRVHCEYCDGTGKGSTPFHSGEEELKAEQAKCFECDGTGKMEIRRSERFDWASCCPSCGGQGFNDVWNAHYEEHDTVDCADCNATGGIPYTPGLPPLIPVTLPNVIAKMGKSRTTQ